jgi:hypothetical protein
MGPFGSLNGTSAGRWPTVFPPPSRRSKPSNSKLEAAYHKADAAIQNIVDLLAAARCYRSVFLFKIFELRFYPTLSGRR